MPTEKGGGPTDNTDEGRDWEASELICLATSQREVSDCLRKALAELKAMEGWERSLQEQLALSLAQSLRELLEVDLAECQARISDAEDLQHGAEALHALDFGQVRRELRAILREGFLSYGQRERIWGWLEEGFEVAEGREELRRLNSLRLSHLQFAYFSRARLAHFA